MLCLVVIRRKKYLALRNRNIALSEANKYLVKQVIDLKNDLRWREKSKEI